MILDREELEPDLKNAIINRFEPWELIEFLNIDIEDIVDIFEEDLLENIEDIKSILKYGETDIDED